MLASFLITFREGLEAFLIVGIMLSYLEKSGARAFSRYIYLGVLGGLLASVVVAFLFQVVVSQFESEYYQQCLMTFILLFASGVLTYMVIWMQRQTRGKTASVERELEARVGRGDLIGMVALSGVAVLREGFETVLFFSALMYSAGGAALTLETALIGAVAGLAASIGLVYALLRGTRRVPLRAFFKYSGLLLLVIAAGLFSSGVNLLQAIEVLPVLVPELFDISHVLDDSGEFGIFLRALFGYNSSPSLLPFLAWVLYLGIFLVLWRRAYATAPA